MLKQLTHSSFGILASVLGTIVVFVIAARSLGPAAFGEFSLAYASCSIAGIVFDFGYMTRFLQEARRSKTGHAEIRTATFATKGLLFLVLSLALMLVFLGFGLDVQLGAELWVGVALISMANLFATVLRGLGLHRQDALNNFVANLAGVSVAGIAWWLHAGPQGFAMVVVMVGTVYLGLTLWFWRVHGRVRHDRLCVAAINVEIRQNLPYALDALVQRSFGFLDVVILSAVANPTAVGLYQSGQKIAQGANIFAQPFNNVVLPRLSRVAGDSNVFLAVALKGFALQVVVGLIALVTIAFLGPLLVDFLYTSDYAPAQDLMPLFGFLIAIRYVAAALAMCVTALGHQEKRFRIGVVGLSIMILAASTLGYFYAAKGLIVGLGVASATMSFLFFIVLLRSLQRGLGR